MHLTLASYPGPAQLSIAIGTEKWERAWYLFSHEWHQDRKDGRKGLIVHGHTRPRTAKEAKVPAAGNLPHISSYWGPTVVHTKCWACSWLKIHETQLLVLPISDHVMLTWEKIPGSSHFSILKATERWGGAGNEAIMDWFECLFVFVLPLFLPNYSLTSVWAS